MDVQKLFFARDWKRKKEEKAQAKGALKKLKGMVQAVTSFSGHTCFIKNEKAGRTIHRSRPH